MLTKDDLKQIELIVGRVVERKLIPIRREIREIKKSINILVDHFDREAVVLHNRVDRIERHLKLPPN